MAAEGRERAFRAPAGPTVVDIPAEVDMSNAEHVQDILRSALVPGTTVVIADLTATTCCDMRGARAFATARMHAIENGAVLRLVIPSATVRRAFEVIELDRLLPIYPSLSMAMAPEIEAAS